ncbi:MAG: hypothetical protein ACI9VI_003262, partial [Candidatus Azotimanducaceae bacterium]
RAFPVIESLAALCLSLAISSVLPNECHNQAVNR